MNRRVRGWIGLALSTALWGCAQEPSLGQHAAAITHGGASSRAAVVAVGFQRASCDASLAPVCSGVLIGPSLVLTAGHCVDRLGADYEVFVGADTHASGSLYAVTEIVLHPDFDDVDNLNDLAILRLDRDTGVAAVPLASTALNQDSVGEVVTVAGFGKTASGAADEGMRLEGSSTVSAIEPDSFTTVPGPAMSCLIDSGGPSFAGAEADERLIGVTSAGDPGCVEWGRSVDVGAYRETFIEPAALNLPASPQTQRCADEDRGCTVSAVPSTPGTGGLTALAELVVLSLWLAARRRRKTELSSICEPDWFRI